MKKKLIIFSPDFNAVGGVSIYVNSLKGHWPVKEEYITRGARVNEICKLCRLTKDFIRIFALLFNERNKHECVVFINTSMKKNAMRRDFIYMLLFKMFSFDYSVFIHGWDANYYKASGKKYNKIFNSATNIFVLSDEFKNQLHEQNIKANVHVETTLVHEDLIKYIKSKTIKFKYNIEDCINILFLSRLEPEKGVHILINAFRNLNKNSQLQSKVTLTIAGAGSLEKDIVQTTKDIPNINFIGFVAGERKYDLITSSDIHILPTSHNEGMPISIIEALTAGNFIICSKKGALPSIINDSNGILIDEVNEKDIIEAILKATDILKNNKFNKKTSMNNAINKYSVRSITSRLSGILNIN